ncbi:MAG: hypothetical protein ACJ8AO_17770 [Gemmatimonadaceae bacterium]
MPATARSVGAVVLGFVLIGALSIGTDGLLIKVIAPGLFDARGVTTSVPMLLLTQAYVGVYAVFGCWLAARLAPTRPMLHALVLGGLGLVLNVVGTIQRWDYAPVWYHALALALVMPYAWAGGRIRERQLESGQAAVALAA